MSGYGVISEVPPVSYSLRATCYNRLLRWRQAIGGGFATDINESSQRIQGRLVERP
jgi:hypothetical protein